MFIMTIDEYALQNQFMGFPNLLILLSKYIIIDCAMSVW